jgi:hypothetical protein
MSAAIISTVSIEVLSENRAPGFAVLETAQGFVRLEHLP